MTLTKCAKGKPNSVRRGWFLSYVMVLAVPLILCLLLYLFSYHMIVAESEKSYGSTLDQLRIDLDAYLTEIQQVQERVLLDRSVQKATNLVGLPDADGQLILRESMNSLSSIQLNHPNINNVFVALNGTNGIISPKGYFSQNVFFDLYCKNSGLSRADLEEVLRGSYPTWKMVRFQASSGVEELWFLRTTMSSSLGRSNATVVVCIRQDLLEQRLEQFQWDRGMDLYAVGMDGEVVCQTCEPGSNDANYLALDPSSNFAKTQNHMVLVQNSGFAGWRYILVLSKSLMLRNTKRVHLFTWLGLMFCTLLGLALSSKLTRFNYRPLGTLVDRYVPDQSNPQLMDKNEYEQLDYYVQKYYQERGDVQHELWNSEQTLQQYYLYSLLQSPHSAREIQRDSARYHLVLDSKNYLVILFSMGELNTDKGFTCDLVKFALLNIFQEAAGVHFKVHTTEVGRDGTALVGMPAATPEAFACLEEDIRFVAQKMQEHFHVTVRAAEGGLHPGTEEISTSYAEALEAMSYLLAGEDADLICYRDICDARSSYTFPAETERRLIDLVAMGNGEQAAQLVRQTFPVEPDSTVNSPGVARCLAYDITSALIKGAGQGGVEDFENVRFATGEQNNPEELQRHLTRTAVTLCERVRLNKENASPNRQLCEDVKQYIDQNYSDPDLNISQTGMHFNITPAYLSSIFKKETGISLLGYINKVRIDRAKVLLLQGLAVAHIAEQTGFRDSSALIRVFKKATGTTPGAYRAAHLGSGN